MSAAEEPGGYHLPYEEIPGGPIHQDITIDDMAGEITVKSAVLDTSLGPFPVVIFTFWGPGDDGVHTKKAEVPLLLDVLHMLQVKHLVAQTIDAAVAASLQR